MCGILGYYNEIGELDKKKRKGINKSFAALEVRGRHASGVAGAKDNNLWLYKDALPSSQLVTHKDYRDIVSTTPCGILHSRFTTQGSETKNENNHPFMEKMFDGSIIAMVHNGVISNYKTLAKRFKLASHIETDSYVMIHMIEKYYSKYKDMEEAISHTVRWLEGSFALMFIHVTKDNKPVMYFLKHKNPLVAASYNGCKLLCSTDTILKKGFSYETVYEIEEDKLYKLNGSPEVWICGSLKTRVPITPKTTTYYYPETVTYPGYSYYGRKDYWTNKTTKCSGCGQYKGDTIWSTIHQSYLCEECCDKKDAALKATSPKHSALNNWGVCDYCQKQSETTIYRKALSGYVCDDCLLEAYAEGGEPIPHEQEQYCLD